MTTDIDKVIDNALAELPEIPAPRSVWRAVEAEMDRINARLRLRRLLLAGGAGIAAALVVTSALLLESRAYRVDHSESATLADTVTTAVRQARPRAQFTGHAYGGSWMVRRHVFQTTRSDAEVMAETVSLSKESNAVDNETRNASTDL